MLTPFVHLPFAQFTIESFFTIVVLQRAQQVYSCVRFHSGFTVHRIILHSVVVFYILSVSRSTVAMEDTAILVTVHHAFVRSLISAIYSTAKAKKKK